MTTSDPMSREELLELAALDAFGLLEKYERMLFTRSFHHAPVAVQDEVKELQASYAADPPLLGEVEPPAGLKAKVLGRIASEVESEQGELSPIAMIGPSRAAHARPRSGGGSRTPTHFWRAAAFLLAASHLVVAYFVIQLNRQYVQLTDDVVNQGMQEAIRTVIGADAYRDFVNNPNSIKVAISSADGAPATGWLYLRESTKNKGTYDLLVVTEGLAPADDFELVAIDGNDDEVFERAYRTGVGRVTSRIIKNVPAQFATVATSLTWQLTHTATGETVLGLPTA